MAIYHCSIKIIGRSDGKSAVASSAYRSGEKLMDDRTGLVHDCKCQYMNVQKVENKNVHFIR